MTNILNDLHLVLDIVQFFLFTLQILTTIMILISHNPIYSVLYLVLLFVESSLVLLFFKVEFFAFLIILIYVGAIAVLFLFIVMMLKIKNQSLSYFFSFFFFSVTIYSFSIYFFYNADTNIVSLWRMNPLASISPVSLSELQILGQVLYNYYLINVLIAGYILYIALIGAIVLTLDVKKSQFKSLNYRRSSRINNTITFFN